MPWKETLANGDTATLLIWPQQYQAFAILRVDEQFHSAYEFDASEQAIEKGWDLHQPVLDGKLDQLTDYRLAGPWSTQVSPAPH